VDHVIPISSRPDLRLDPANLRALCLTCHNRRSMLDQKSGESRVTATASPEGLPLDPRHPWHNRGKIVAAPLSRYGLSLDSLRRRFNRLDGSPQPASDEDRPEGADLPLVVLR
jgi:hypothetical protein